MTLRNNLHSSQHDHGGHAIGNAIVADASADPYAGSNAPNGKLIYTADQAADNLNRYDVDWTQGAYGALDDGVLTFDFWTYEEFIESYYFERTFPDGSPVNNDAYFGSYADGAYFAAFTAEQEELAANAVELWDDLIAIDIVRADASAGAAEADITFGAVYMSPAAGAHAYYPQAEAIDQYYGTESYGLISGDVWINWLYRGEFTGSGPGDYGWYAITHELGHSFGLAHGGDYNASDDNDGDGEPDPITYQGDAYFYQDSEQYTLMSYFSGRETGASWVEWGPTGGTFMAASTPMVHDVLAVQKVYGADMTTRTGDTVYGFNSNAGNIVFDFAVTKVPVVTIWDAGGNDTLDFSGYTVGSVIDLNDGAFSSAGHGMGADSKAFYGLDTQAKVDAFLARNGISGPEGRPNDNIAIAYGATIENAIGGAGNDLIVGNEVGNRLVGNGGADRLIGNGGADRLIGGDGVDVFTGGAGDDTIVAELNSATVSSKQGLLSIDIINDFDQAGNDVIDLSGLDANLGRAGDQNFTFRGTSTGNNAGDITWKSYGNVNAAEKSLGIDIDGYDGVSAVKGPVTVVFGNNDADKAADFALVLMNTSSVDATDFLFG